MGRIRRYTVGSFVNGAQSLSLETVAHPFVAGLNTLLVQSSNDARPAVTTLTTHVNRGHVRIERLIGHRSLTGFSPSPLAIPRTGYLQLAGHPRHIELIAMFFHPGVPHRDSFAKYAAAFFTISKSSFALDSSRRNRTFSASNSTIVRFTGTALPVTAFSLPDRLSSSQFHKLEYGTPNRFAASVHPIDSLNRTPSTLNSA